MLARKNKSTATLFKILFVLRFNVPVNVSVILGCEAIASWVLTSPVES